MNNENNENNTDNTDNTILKETNIINRDKLYTQYDDILKTLQHKYNTLYSKIKNKKSSNHSLKPIFKQYKNQLKESKDEIRRVIKHLEDLKTYLDFMDDELSRSLREKTNDFTNHKYLKNTIEIQRKNIDEQLEHLNRLQDEI